MRLKAILAPLVLGLVLGSCAVQPKVAARAPNIIFILADDMGYADIGSYGQEMVATPNIDRMVAEGVRFTDFYAGAPVCAPSRSVLMTGLHTGHTSVRGNSTNDIQQLRPSETTVAQMLSQFVRAEQTVCRTRSPLVGPNAENIGLIGHADGEGVVES